MFNNGTSERSLSSHSVIFVPPYLITLCHPSQLSPSKKVERKEENSEHRQELKVGKVGTGEEKYIK